MVGIWIYLFQEDMFFYKTRLLKNLNHSIRMGDAQVMVKTQSWGRKGKLDSTSLRHTHTHTHTHALRQKLNRVGEKTIPQIA